MALSGVALARLKKEMEMLFKDPPPGISAWVKEDDSREVEAGALASGALRRRPRL